MAALTLKDFPDDVYRALKAQAALEGRSLRALVIEILTQAAKKKGAKK